MSWPPLPLRKIVHFLTLLRNYDSAILCAATHCVQIISTSIASLIKSLSASQNHSNNHITLGKAFKLIIERLETSTVIPTDPSPSQKHTHTSFEKEIQKYFRATVVPLLLNLTALIPTHHGDTHGSP